LLVLAILYYEIMKEKEYSQNLMLKHVMGTLTTFKYPTFYGHIKDFVYSTVTCSRD